MGTEPSQIQTAAPRRTLRRRFGYAALAVAAGLALRAGLPAASATRLSLRLSAGEAVVLMRLGGMAVRYASSATRHTLSIEIGGA